MHVKWNSDICTNGEITLMCVSEILWLSFYRNPSLYRSLLGLLFGVSEYNVNMPFMYWHNTTSAIGWYLFFCGPNIISGRWACELWVIF